MSLLLTLVLATATGPPVELPRFTEGTSIVCYYAPNIEHTLLEWLTTMVPIPFGPRRKNAAEELTETGDKPRNRRVPGSVWK